MCGGRQEKHITLCSKLIFLGICDMSAAMYYGYTDRAPGVWHIAVDNKSARNKFKMDFPIIKPHFIETSRLDIGDKKKDAVKLMMYASKLGVEKKARRVVGIWL